MSDWALFINGIYRSVLQEILAAQLLSPDMTFYLHPHGGGAIVRLRNEVPSLESPVALYASTTDDLKTVSYMANIVGWENKLDMNQASRQEIDAIIRQYQPCEGGLYDASATPGSPSLNLLHLRQMTKLDAPFSVAKLIKVSDGKPLSTNRSRAGGYSYVRISE